MAEPQPLSDRELDIMRRVATGASNREIAHALDISPNTVKVHLRNIFEKLGVASRTEATLVALREGLVAVDGVGAAQGLAAAPAALVAEAPPLAEADEPLFEAEAALVDDARPTALTLAPVVEPPARVVARPIVVSAEPARAQGPGWMTMVLGGAVLVLLVLVLLQTLRPAPTVPSSTTVAVPERWQQLAQLPAARVGATALTVGRDLLLVGGEGAGEADLATLRYDGSVGRWDERAALPRPAPQAAVALVGGGVVVAGGLREDGQPTDEVRRYDPAADRWETIEPLPRPLARAALAAFEGELFLFGGWDGAVAQVAVYRWQASEGTWTEVAQLPSARAELAAAAVADGILLAGGTDAAGTPLSEVWHFDPRAAEPFQAEAPLPAAQPAPALVTLGNALYLLGEGALLERDTDQRWNALALPDATLPTDAALAVMDPYIVVLGGQADEQPVSTVWQYQAVYRSFIPLVPGN